ncbi:benzoate/H(+) symporter BenE family transporter [Alteromonas halophila]|uniref:Benzoate transporter n=1 Tax=Alteromonas halophila TaxID=516698 RepID=A0A918MX65_9ALTE|nr:benzoate/H(+) symporter BenE family transporter [Alteromonas halophila]GGW80540.1 benzoate transporter [Alteromonas halophila]
MKVVSVSHLAAGFTAVIVGYSSAVVLVIEAARAAGANDSQVISWLMALGIGMGVTCIAYSWFSKMPIVTAWSTPGAAFLIGSVQGFSLSEVIGACLVSTALTLLCVSFRQLFVLIERIPANLCAALLAGILVPICLNMFEDLTQSPWLVAAFVLLYVAGRRLFARYLMLVMLLVSVITGYLMAPLESVTVQWPELVWQSPTFSVAAAISLGVPLFLVTMLSQNLPGIAIHLMHHYKPDHRSVLRSMSVIQALLVPFGGFTFNLAAITAALCMGEDADPDPQQRYKAAIVAGVGYLLMALLSSLVVIVFMALPAVIVHLLAGLALLPTLYGALAKAMEDESARTAAVITLLCSASGVTVAGLSGPVWGLILGVIAYAIEKKSVRYKNRAGA